MNSRGFTLIELMITVAIIGVLAAAAFFGTRAAVRNADVDRSGAEFAGRIEDLRIAAMREGRVYLFVGADATDPSTCSLWRQEPCARYFVLSSPTVAWRIGSFNPTTPTAEARFEEEVVMRGRVRFLRSDVPRAPRPLDTLPTTDADILATCADGRRCFALRFSPNGTVRPELAPGAPSPKRGFVVALASDLVTEAEIAADQRGGSKVFGVAVGFPYGIVRTY